MDIITMKLLEKKFNLPIDIIRCKIYPSTLYEKLTNETIRVAVKLYISNRDECVRQFGQIQNWNTSDVTLMCGLFYGFRNFNADISRWNVSNVRNMSTMFFDARSFNADISGWRTSNVHNMSAMFFDAQSFNADISGWDVSKCEDMREMFADALSFNADLSSWRTSNVHYMNHMSDGATNFDRQTTANWIIHPNANTLDMFG